jgi:hypothetical protein
MEKGNIDIASSRPNNTKKDAILSRLAAHLKSLALVSATFVAEILSHHDGQFLYGEFSLRKEMTTFQLVNEKK